MSTITIKMKSGETRVFRHEDRPGVSYLSHEGAFAVATDKDGRRTSIPACDILEIVDTPNRW